MAYPPHVGCAFSTIVFGVGSVALCALARAEVKLPEDSPYRVILDRNPFGLRPAPTNALTAPTSPPPVKVNVQLSGITDDPFGKKAWLVIPVGPGRTNVTYLSMREGDVQGDLKVVEIDVRGRTVKVVNAGNAATLDFAHDSPATPPPTAPAGPGGPRAGPAPAIPTPAPAVRTASYAPANPQPGVAPGSSLSLPTGTPPVTAAPMTTVASTAGESSMPALRTIPARSIRTPDAATGSDVDPAVQYLKMKAAEAEARARGIPYPPLPPMPGLAE